LNEEIACQAVWAFNQDEADAVPCDPFQQRLEAFTLSVINGSTHPLIPELPDHLNSVALGIGLDGFPLPWKAVSCHLPNGGHSVVRDGLNGLRCHVQSVAYSGQIASSTQHASKAGIIGHTSRWVSWLRDRDA
jgi:hypothetical protein